MNAMLIAERLWARYSHKVARAALAVCAAIIGLFGLLPGTAAAWSPGCFGTSCRGKDPQWTGCAADARTIAVRPFPGTASAGFYEVVELRYSPRCNARWSRVTSRLAHADILYTSAWIAGHSSTRVMRSGATVVWSRMWSGAVSACGVSVWTADPTYKPLNCAP